MRLFLKILRIVFFSAVVLVTLAALLLAEENFRAKWLWERHKRQAEARGERFDLAAFTASPVPDDQNFYMTPLLKPVFENPQQSFEISKGLIDGLEKRLMRFDPQFPHGQPWLRRGWVEGRSVDQEAWKRHLQGVSLLKALETIGPELDEIARASRRPFANLPPEYASHYRLISLRYFTQILGLRATARLVEGQPGAALEDVETLLGITKAVSEPPLLMSLFMQTSFVNADLQPVWEGLAAHSWNESQLSELQKALSGFDFLAAGLRDLKGERAFGVATFQTQVTGPWKLARNIMYQNLLAISLCYDKQFFPLLDPGVRVISPKALPAVDKKAPSTMWWHPYTGMVELVMPVMNVAFKKIAYAQTSLDEARVACALERYRLASGEYPEHLDALVPRYLERVPWDIITGHPFHYQRTAEGLFVLYSVGWNGIDDHAAVPESNDLDQGDWAWFYPGFKPLAPTAAVPPPGPVPAGSLGK